MTDDRTHDPDDATAAWRAILLTQASIVREVEEELRRGGYIPLTWYDVLLELLGGPLRVQDVSSRVVLSRSRVSRLVAEIEESGLLERRADPTDGRATLVAITPAGRGALKAAWPAYREVITRRLNDRLTASEQRTIVRALAKVIDTP